MRVTPTEHLSIMQIFKMQIFAQRKKETVGFGPVLFVPTLQQLVCTLYAYACDVKDGVFRHS